MLQQCATFLMHSLFLYFSFQMSSFVFFVVAPIMLYLLHPYAKERNLAVHLVWLMMIFVGECPPALICRAAVLPIGCSYVTFISHSYTAQLSGPGWDKWPVVSLGCSLIYKTEGVNAAHCHIS